MNTFYAILGFAVSLFLSPALMAQDPLPSVPRDPATGEPLTTFPCPPEDIPIQTARFGSVFIVVNLEGSTFTEGDDVYAYDAEHMIGVGFLRFEDSGCGRGEEFTIVMNVYRDVNACATDWGAETGDNIRFVVVHEGNYYQIRANFPFPDDQQVNTPSTVFFEEENGDDCIMITVDPSTDIIFGPALPATITAFRGVALSQKLNRLDWEVAQEENVGAYEVERSVTGTDWATIGTVAAVGNSRTHLEYSFADNTAPEQRSLYRLRTVDTDGSFEYSNVVIVEPVLGGAPAVRVFPNPTDASGMLSVQLTGDWDQTTPASAQLYDAAGRLTADYQNLVVGSNALALPAATAPGLYLVRTVQAGRVVTAKVLLR